MEVIIYTRKCFTCGERLGFHGFHIAVLSQETKAFDDLIEEMWENPIFVIECCKCYGYRTIADYVEKRIANRPYKCSECGDGINNKGLCYVCYFDKKAKE